MGDMRKILDAVNTVHLNESRHNNLVLDAFKALDRMTDNIIGADKSLDDIRQVIRETSKKLSNKIPPQWKMFFAEYAVYHLYSLMGSLYSTQEPLIAVQASKKANRNASLNDASFVSNHRDLRVVMDKMVEQLNHFHSIPFSKIQNINVESTKHDGFVETLLNLEREFRSASRGVAELTGKEETILKFSDGYAWINLKTNSCTIEAEAMGHCGNGATSKNDDEVLSLRKIEMIDGQPVHTPALTFILNNGMLGEMKGRENNKPSPQYHKYIVALLKLPMIKGISGGGYKRETNFNLYDLDDKTREEFLEFKGDFKVPVDEKLLSLSLRYDRKNIPASEMCDILNREISSASKNKNIKFEVYGEYVSIKIADYEMDDMNFATAHGLMRDIGNVVETCLGETNTDKIADAMSNYQPNAVRKLLDADPDDDLMGYSGSTVLNVLPKLIQMGTKQNHVKLMTLGQSLEDLFTRATQGGSRSDDIHEIRDILRKRLSKIDDYTPVFSKDVLVLKHGQLSKFINYLIDNDPFDGQVSFSIRESYDKSVISLEIPEIFKAAFGKHLEDFDDPYADLEPSAALAIIRDDMRGDIDDENRSSLIDIIAEDANASYEYARDVLGARFADGEPAISDDHEVLVDYIRFVISIGGDYEELDRIATEDITDVDLMVVYAAEVRKMRIQEREVEIFEEASSEKIELYLRKFKNLMQESTNYDWFLANPYYGAYYIKYHGMPSNSARIMNAIAKNANAAYYYSESVLKARYPEGEAAILSKSSPTVVYDYISAYMPKTRVVNAEERLSKDARVAVNYAFEFLRGSRFKEAEPTIAKDAEQAYSYAKNILKDVFPEAEQYIAHSPYAYQYAANVVKGNFSRGEKKIASNKRALTMYIRDVMDSRSSYIEDILSHNSLAIKDDPEMENAVVAYEKKFSLRIPR